MSVSSISSSSSVNQTDWRSLMSQLVKDFTQLASSLKSGDLEGAQKAYTALQQLLPGNQAGGQSSASNPLQNDFAALGQALNSGDLSAAQSAFSQLQTDMQAAAQSSASGAVQSAHHGHHHHRHVSSGSDSDSSTASSQSTTTGNTVSVYA